MQGYSIIFLVGLVVAYFFREERTSILALTLYMGLMAVIEWFRHRKPMKVYSEGIYVYGLYAMFDEVEIDKGVENGKEYINIRIPYTLAGKYDIRVTGKEDIEKLERVVDISEV